MTDEAPIIALRAKGHPDDILDSARQAQWFEGSDRQEGGRALMRALAEAEECSLTGPFLKWLCWFGAALAAGAIVYAWGWM